MATISPLRASLADKEIINDIIAPPYDVLNQQEVLEIAGSKINNILRVTRAECFTSEKNTSLRYQLANEELVRLKKNVFKQPPEACYFLYEIAFQGHTQRGLYCYVDCCALKRHEHTRSEKVADRFQLSQQLMTQISPVLLSIKPNSEFKSLFNTLSRKESEYSVSHAKSQHRLIKISEKEDIKNINKIIRSVDNIYIADGHHRAKTQHLLHTERPSQFSNQLLAVVFLADDLNILGYHRVIETPDNFDSIEFQKALSTRFILEPSDTAVLPTEKSHFGLYLDNQWFNIISENKIDMSVDILHKEIIEPYFGITDPREDDRIDFVGGRDAAEQVQRRVNQMGGLGLTLAPIGMNEIINVSDQNKILPPKSTWFEPKLLDGFLFST
jgi:uncharacterized protein (DUF1015 family)